MSEIRLIPAILEISFEDEKNSSDIFFNEFNSLTKNEEDPLGAWLKRAKAKGDTKESDQVLLTLVIELHRKLDELKEKMENKTKERVALNQTTNITKIGFDYIYIQDPSFERGKKYYARIEMPIFPKRTIALYIKAIDKNTAEILTMHSDDEHDWNSYVTARERVLIRQMKTP